MKEKNILTAKQTGITLIALIITIIVMLILVGVTINILISNNIIGAAKTAVEGYKNEADKEKIIKTEIVIDKKTYESIEDYIAENEKVILPEDWKKMTDEEIEENEKTTDWDTSKVTPITDGTNNVPLPKGYIVSEEDEEQTVDGGLVIKDSHGNEFVWIPVPDGVEVATCAAPYEKISGFKEPKVLTATYSSSGYAYDSQETLTYLYGTKEDGTIPYFDYANDFKYEDEYIEMAESVNKYHGFFVGRYETTIDSNGNIGSVYNTPVLTPDQTMFTKDSTDYPYRWYGMYYVQKTTPYIERNGQNVQSAMTYGQLLDKIMTFVNGKTDGAGNTFDIGTASSLRHTGSKANSGQNNNDLVANIYDLEGNFNELTQEAFSDGKRALCRWLLQ